MRLYINTAIIYICLNHKTFKHLKKTIKSEGYREIYDSVYQYLLKKKKEWSITHYIPCARSCLKMKHDRGLFSNIQMYGVFRFLLMNLQWRLNTVEDWNNNSQLLGHEEELIHTPLWFGIPWKDDGYMNGGTPNSVFYMENEADVEEESDCVLGIWTATIAMVGVIGICRGRGRGRGRGRLTANR